MHFKPGTYVKVLTVLQPRDCSRPIIIYTAEHGTNLKQAPKCKDWYIDFIFLLPGDNLHVTKMAQAENDMTKTLVVVVLMFMSCQLLNPIRRILLAVLPAGSLGCGSTD